MSGAQSKSNELKFLAGGGEMSRRIEAFDWTQSPLGPIHGWPQSLKTSVSLMLNSQHPMWIGWGPVATFLYNDAYVAVLSLAKHPWALGRPAAEVWAEIWDVCGPLAERVFKHGQACFASDVRLFMSRGDFIEEGFYSFSYSPIRDESGNVGGLFCPSADDSARVLNTRRLSVLAELAGEAMGEKSTEGAAAAACSILAKHSEDIPFALLYLLDDPADCARLTGAAGVARGVDGISPESLSLNKSEPGKSFWPISEVTKGGRPVVAMLRGMEGFPLGLADQPLAEAMVLPLMASSPERPLGVLIAGVNPTRRLDAEYRTFYDLVAGNVVTALQNARAAETEKKRADALAELDRAKTTFFNNVSHELRTPLTLILSPLEEELREGKVPSERLELAHRNALRLLRLVNALLDFSRIEAGRLEASFEATDLAAFTAELAGVFRPTVERGGLKLIIDCPPLSEPALIDRDMWEKIVFNLMSNAFKFTIQGEIEIKLRETRGLADNEKQITLSVRDTGTGIPDDQLSRIFERFHRVRNLQSRSHEGTGIGLALVHELAHLHGGSVCVDSSVGHGTTFFVSVPAGQAHVPKDRVVASVRHLEAAPDTGRSFVEESLRWLPTDAPPAAARPISPQARILLADDNADMREYVARLLTDQGYEVSAVENGKFALELAQKTPPALVLSDVMMPQLDGFGLVDELRKDPRTRFIPIILLSARAGAEARAEGAGAGADDYLTKPFSARELLARVGTHLNLARMRDESRQALQDREEKLRAANLLLGDKAKLLESIVQERTVRLQETIGELEAFSYSIAHDMRAPLRSLQGFSEILLADYGPELDDAGRHLLQRIDKAAGRMDLLIADVLSYSRIIRGDFPFQSVDLQNLLTDLIDTYPNFAADKADITIDGPLPSVSGNEGMLTQVFSNLMGNAVKFVPAGVKPKLRIWAETRETTVRVLVKDNGIGIAADQHRKIFEMFVQVDTSHEGTGIGLAIVKKAIERIGGSVGIKSTPGQGSTFWVELKKTGSDQNQT